MKKIIFLSLIIAVGINISTNAQTVTAISNTTSCTICVTEYCYNYNVSCLMNPTASQTVCVNPASSTFSYTTMCSQNAFYAISWSHSLCTDAPISIQKVPNADCTVMSDSNPMPTCDCGPATADYIPNGGPFGDMILIH